MTTRQQLSDANGRAPASASPQPTLISFYGATPVAQRAALNSGQLCGIGFLQHHHRGQPHSVDRGSDSNPQRAGLVEGRSVA
jgi:hypothetical protein